MERAVVLVQRGHYLLIELKFDARLLFENLSRKLSFRENLTGIVGILRDDVCTHTVFH